MKLCHELLEQLDVESAIRVGDVYALMVEWFYSQHQMEQAYNLIEKSMSLPGLDSEGGGCRMPLLAVTDVT